MLNWYSEFSLREYLADSTTDTLVAKGLLEVVGGRIMVTTLGLEWLKRNSRFY